MRRDGKQQHFTPDKPGSRKKILSDRVKGTGTGGDCMTLWILPFWERVCGIKILTNITYIRQVKWTLKKDGYEVSALAD